MNISNIGFNSYVNLVNKFPLSFGMATKSDNKLERTPSTDKFELREVDLKRKKLSQTEIQKIASDLEYVKEEELLNEELLYFLQPKKDAKGRISFTPSQALVIGMATNKIKHFKKLANTLHSEAVKYGEDCANQMKEVFGGDKGLGKYVEYRAKDSESIYNKLVKEYKDNKVNAEMMDILSRKAFKLPIDELDKEDKALLKIAVMDGDISFDSRDYRKIADILKHSRKDHLESINYIKDLVGTRLVLPVGDQKELSMVEKYLTKAITNGDLQVTRVSNYHANHILPYISHDVAKHWKQIVPGLRVVETKEVRKKNGYTTTQINVVHKVKTKNGTKDVLGEFQIRTKELNYIGNVEHLIYDILQNKNISKNIPELKAYYDKIGIEKDVREVFNDPKKELAYFNYEKAMYYWVRNNETQKDTDRKYPKPRLYEYGLGEYWNTLSFDSLMRIDKTASAIKKKYKESNKVENK